MLSEELLVPIGVEVVVVDSARAEVRLRITSVNLVEVIVGGLVVVVGIVGLAVAELLLQRVPGVLDHAWLGFGLGVASVVLPTVLDLRGLRVAGPP